MHEKTKALLAKLAALNKKHKKLERSYEDVRRKLDEQTQLVDRLQARRSRSAEMQFDYEQSRRK